MATNISSEKQEKVSEKTPLLSETNEEEKRLEMDEKLKKAVEGSEKVVYGGRRWLVGIDGSKDSESALFFAVNSMDKEKDTLFILNAVKEDNPK